jgi:hypothetical protein
VLSEKKENLQGILSKNIWKFKLFKSMKFIGYILKANKEGSLPILSEFQLGKSEFKMEIIKNQWPIIIVYIFFIKEHVHLKCLNLNLRSEASVLISNKYFGLYFDHLILFKLISANLN